MLESTIAELKQRKGQIASQIASLEAESRKLDKALKVLGTISGKNRAAANPARRRRKFSAQAIAKIRAAQKRRWAAWKAKQQPAK